MTEKKYGGIIRNATQPMLGVSVWGELYKDPQQRFPEGAEVRTSRVVSIDENAGKIETLNTIYDYVLLNSEEM